MSLAYSALLGGFWPCRDPTTLPDATFGRACFCVFLPLVLDGSLEVLPVVVEAWLLYKAVCET